MYNGIKPNLKIKLESSLNFKNKYQNHNGKVCNSEELASTRCNGKEAVENFEQKCAVSK
jgi:hypothetical protein